jgi:flavodoxin
MKTLVVYESMFGNTGAIAHAIASGLESHSDVEVHDVHDVPSEAVRTADLIVAGGPTHAFSMSRPSTRADAVKQGAPQRDAAAGLREWLAELSSSPGTALVATFDTRVDKVRHRLGRKERVQDTAPVGLPDGGQATQLLRLGHPRPPPSR